MGKNPTPEKDIAIMRGLRSRGQSLPEISKVVGKGKSTVYRYIKDVKVSPEFESILRSKQGGSVARSKQQWEEAKKNAKKLIPTVTKKDKLVALSCLYWSEGNKTDLNFINSDPEMIKAFVRYLGVIGVNKNNLKITLRVYSDVSKSNAVQFWSKLLEIPQSQISNINVLFGKKEGKLKHGMCRVRVRKGGKSFKLIMSMIDLLKFDSR